MNIKMIGAAVLVGAVVAGCGTKEEDKAVLAVNGKQLMQSQVDADVESILKAQGDKVPADQQDYYRQMIRNQIAQSFIVENVLVARAKANGFQVTDADRKAREAEFLKAIANQPDAPKTVEEYFKKFPLGEQRARDEFENGILIDKMMKEEQAKAPGQNYEAKAKEIVDGIVSNNAANATADADALKKIKDLKAELDKTPAAELPKKFAELAKANSACPSSQKGGDLGEFTHGQMVKEFDEVAFKLPVNTVSEPVKTQFGYHLIMTTKKVAAVEAAGDKPAEPEKVQASHILIKVGSTQPVPKMEEVVSYLKKQDERKFVQEFVMNLVKAAKVEAFAEEYKQFVPPADEPAAEPEKKPEATPVEQSAQK